MYALLRPIKTFNDRFFVAKTRVRAAGTRGEDVLRKDILEIAKFSSCEIENRRFAYLFDVFGYVKGIPITVAKCILSYTKFLAIPCGTISKFRLRVLTILYY